ncbi:MAG: hypothetical protein BWX84_02741 [Verrucomicrobia bacterium ADurb.Bin118]|nr:MAG: hypothetical protein BWX84_02741 [Verrucomicrobia bacterium ADurb.Bin118]
MAGSDDLTGYVSRDFRRSILADFNFVFFSIGGFNFPSQICDRSGEQIQIVWQRGRHECECQLHTGAFEGIDRAGRQHFEFGLGQRGRVGGSFAHYAKRSAVNPHETGEPLRFAGPVGGVRVGQFVRRRPDAEIRIAGHQRHGGWAQRGRLLRDGAQHGLNYQSNEQPHDANNPAASERAAILCRCDLTRANTGRAGGRFAINQPHISFHVRSPCYSVEAGWGGGV